MKWSRVLRAVTGIFFRYFGWINWLLYSIYTYTVSLKSHFLINFIFSMIQVDLSWSDLDCQSSGLIRSNFRICLFLSVTKSNPLRETQCACLPFIWVLTDFLLSKWILLNAIRSITCFCDDRQNLTKYQHADLQLEHFHPKTSFVYYGSIIPVN